LCFQSSSSLCIFGILEQKKVLFHFVIVLKHINSIKSKKKNKEKNRCYLSLFQFCHKNINNRKAKSNHLEITLKLIYWLFGLKLHYILNWSFLISFNWGFNSKLNYIVNWSYTSFRYLEIREWPINCDMLFIGHKDTMY
jgi:hypothetical protein